MFHVKNKCKCIIPILLLCTVSLVAEEDDIVPDNYVSADIKVSTDRKDNSKRTLITEMTAGHYEENWFLNAGMRMQKDMTDFTGNIGLKDLYFKKYPIQIGSTLEGYYHIKFIEIGTFEQNMFAAASYFLNLKPSNTRLTVFFGAGLKGSYLAVDAHNPPKWNAYPVVSIFISQNFANFLTINAGIRTFSYFVSTAFIEPQFFASIDLHLNKQLTIQAGVEGIYNSYRKLEDLKNNMDTLELQNLIFNAGIKYQF